MVDIQKAIYMNKVRGLNTPSAGVGSVKGLEGVPGDNSENPPPVEDITPQVEVPNVTPPEATTDGSIPPPAENITTADGSVVQDVTVPTDTPPPPMSPGVEAAMRELSKHSGLDTTPIVEPPASENS